jgi:hypothetical protein
MNWKRILTISVFAVVLCAGYALTIVFYFAEEGNKRANTIDSPAVDKNGDYIEATASILSVDLQKENMEVRVEFRPHGKLALAEGILARPVEIHPTGVNAEPLSFAAGDRMLSRDITFDLHGGEVTDYPFDRHTSLIEFLAVEKIEGGAPRPIPLDVNFNAYHHGLAISLKPFASNEGGYVGFEATFVRSNLVMGAAIFCMLVMWGLAVAAILVLFSVLFHDREVDIDKLALLSGLIIALYFFRAALPDTPPTIGTLSDFLAFFWTEAIVSVSSVIYTFVWFQRGRQAIKK